MSISFAATLNIGPEIPGLPYLYTDTLENGCRRIAAAGFQAFDLLLLDPSVLDPEILRDTADRHGLRVSAIASAGAWFNSKLHLCSPDASVRRRAEGFLGALLRLARPAGAAVILGLVAGVLEGGVERAQALDWLVAALDRLGDAAESAGVRLLLETLNAAETNLLINADDGIEVLRRLRTDCVRLVSDVYHFSRSEDSVARAIRSVGSFIGHVHLADSNRRAPGFGRLDFGSVARALKDVGYSGYASVESLPWPNSDAAAAKALRTLHHSFNA